MTTNPITLKMISDDQLWQLSLEGDREAFGQIVERYQTLVCSLAYSACGDLSRSEDLAQEAFITAWQKLGELREPPKLRAWLCGIVRNLASNSVRRERRRGGRAESLDVAGDYASMEADPAQQAVTQEQAAILWGSLAGLPGTYREPLVLFYRQGQSIAEVAEALDLSEEAVRQRLSRGRALLREEISGLVESTLTRTRPGAAFTVGVLVALPMVTPSTASAAIAAGSIAAGGADTAAKGMLGKLGLGVLAGPLIGLACAYFGLKAATSTARSRPERDCIFRCSLWIIAYCLLLSLGLAAVLSQAGKLFPVSAPGLLIGISLWTVALVGGILLMCHRMQRNVERIRIATGTTDEQYARALAFPAGSRGFSQPDLCRAWNLPKYAESQAQFLGLPLFAIEWGGHGADHYRPRKVCAWVAVGGTAFSPFVAFGSVAVAPIAVGAITVGVVSLSLFGVAAGLFALGSLAFGWWAVGFAAAGVKSAVGIVAVARDYALGLVVSAAEAGGPVAEEWFRNLWLADLRAGLVDPLHWWLLGCVLLALVLRVWRNRRQRRASPAGPATTRDPR